MHLFKTRMMKKLENNGNEIIDPDNSTSLPDK